MADNSGGVPGVCASNARAQGVPTIEVVVGVIGRPHGIRGDVSVDLRTDEPERRFADGAVLRHEGTSRTLTVTATRWHQGRFLVRFGELADRSSVETARGMVLVCEVPIDETPDDEGEYYDRQLVGLRVETVASRPVGTVTTVLHLPAQDVLAIATDAGERLVPFVTELVPVVDLAAGKIVLNELPGLLDDIETDTAWDA